MGVPILLREDYQLANMITEGGPASFQQTYVTYSDGWAWPRRLLATPESLSSTNRPPP